jgi:sigma-B regulation protein RsbU (phosphoserine phosphatase)
MRPQERRKKRSLRKKAFWSILAVSLILVVLGSASGLLLHVYSSLNAYNIASDDLIDYMMALEDGEYIDRLFAETKEIYENRPEDLRSLDSIATEEYEALFSHLVDEDYLEAKEILTKCLEETGQENLWLFFYEPSTSAYVYVIDAEADEYIYPPGFWLPQSDQDKIEAICDSDWKLEIIEADEWGFIGANYNRIYSANGEQIGYVEMDLDLTVFFGKVGDFLKLLLPVIILLAILLAWLTSRSLNKSIIRHITELAGAAKEYTARDKTKISTDTPSVFEELSLYTADEIEELWTNMTGMETDVKTSILRIRQMTAEKERIGAELSIATKIQADLLPKNFPLFPDRTDFDVFASMTPAKEVAGDFYDIFMIDEDHLCLVIADVSGKGIPAALFMMVSKSVLENRALMGGTPAEILTDVNAQLSKRNDQKMFVTVWLAIVTLSTGHVTEANAGHENPLICKNKEAYEQLITRHGMVLGALAKAKYKDYEYDLSPGDKIFVYTDGLPEATNTAKQRFAMKRLEESANRHKEDGPEEFLKHVREDVDAFVGEAEQFDDLTMLCFNYRPKG